MSAPVPAPRRRVPWRPPASALALAAVAFLAEALIYREMPERWLSWVGLATLAVAAIALVILLVLGAIVVGARGRAGYLGVRYRRYR